MDGTSPQPGTDDREGSQVDLTTAALYGLFPRTKASPEEQLTAEALSSGYRIDYSHPWCIDQFDELQLGILENEEVVEQMVEPHFEKELLATLRSARRTARMQSNLLPIGSKGGRDCLSTNAIDKANCNVVLDEDLWRPPFSLPALGLSGVDAGRTEWMNRLADRSVPLRKLCAQGIPFSASGRPRVWDALWRARVPTPRALWLVRIVYFPRPRVGSGSRTVVHSTAPPRVMPWADEAPPAPSLESATDLVEYLKSTQDLTDAMPYLLRLMGPLSTAGLADSHRLGMWLLGQLADPQTLQGSTRLALRVFLILLDNIVQEGASHAVLRLLCRSIVASAAAFDLIASAASSKNETPVSLAHSNVGSELRRAIGDILLVKNGSLALIPWQPENRIIELRLLARDSSPGGLNALRMLFEEQQSLHDAVQARVLRWTEADVGRILDKTLVNGASRLAARQLCDLASGPGDWPALIAAVCDWGVADPAGDVREATSLDMAVASSPPPEQNHSNDLELGMGRLRSILSGRRLLCTQTVFGAILEVQTDNTNEPLTAKPQPMSDSISEWAMRTWRSRSVDNEDGHATVATTNATGRRIVQLLLALLQGCSGNTGKGPPFSFESHLDWMLLRSGVGTNCPGALGPQADASATASLSSGLGLLYELHPLCCVDSCEHHAAASTARQAKLWHAMVAAYLSSKGRDMSHAKPDDANPLKHKSQLDAAAHNRSRLTIEDAESFFEDSGNNNGDEQDDQEIVRLKERIRPWVDGEWWGHSRTEGSSTVNGEAEWAQLISDLKPLAPWKQRGLASVVAKWAAGRAQDPGFSPAATLQQSTSRSAVLQWIGHVLTILCCFDAARELSQVLPRLAAPLLQSQLKAVANWQSSDPNSFPLLNSSVLGAVLALLEAWAAPLVMVGLASRVVRMATAALWLVGPEIRLDREPDPVPILLAQLRLARRLCRLGIQAQDEALLAWMDEARTRHGKHWLVNELFNDESRAIAGHGCAYDDTEEGVGMTTLGLPAEIETGLPMVWQYLAVSGLCPKKAWKLLQSRPLLVEAPPQVFASSVDAKIPSTVLVEIVLSTAGSGLNALLSGDPSSNVATGVLDGRSTLLTLLCPPGMELGGVEELFLRFLKWVTPCNVDILKTILGAFSNEATTSPDATEMVVQAIVRAPNATASVALAQLCDQSEALLDALQTSLKNIEQADQADGLVSAILFWLSKAPTSRQRSFADTLLTWLHDCIMGGDSVVHQYGPLGVVSDPCVSLYRLQWWLAALFPLLPLIYQDRPPATGGPDLRSRAITTASRLALQLEMVNSEDAPQVTRRLLVMLQALLMGEWAPWLKGNAPARKLRDVPPFEGSKALVADLYSMSSQMIDSDEVKPRGILSEILRMLQFAPQWPLVSVPMSSANDPTSTCVHPWVMFEGGWSCLLLDQDESKISYDTTRGLITDGQETTAPPWMVGADRHVRLTAWEEQNSC